MGVHIVATGGTIASVTDELGAVRAAATPEDLVRSAPGLDEHGPVTSEEVTRVNGWNVTPADMLEVSRRVEAALQEDSVSGAIVTHGTDTVEETAFVADLTIMSEKPVAFAAAMRSGDQVSADGPRNLLNAARVVTSSEARGLGAVIVLNDELHAARWVRKSDSFRVNTFASPDHGPLGYVTPGELRLFSRPPRRVSVARPAALDAPVPVIKAYSGMEEGLIEAILSATNARGLVIEGTGLGNVPGTAMVGIGAALEQGLPVINATRVSSGGTWAVYGGPGGGVTLAGMGVMPAGTLTAAKARLLLMLLLARGLHGDQLRAHFGDAVAALM
ncbi:asparaginase [soil metagenome]